ncbi:hypothetical protein [Isoptericola aurantiacus]|uniref:hypothetical protein n=1 Tax=Isoptericola aurantiacus TaxID=3377839 RepID=UPI00383B8961
MARRRGPAPVSFDVSHDAARDDGPDGAPAPRAPSGRPGRPSPRAWWAAADRRRRRRAVALVAGAAVVVAGAVVAGSALADRTAADRLRAAPGGVLSLDGDLVRTWRVDAGAVAAVLPDGGLATVEDGALVAHDVASGDERWRVEVGADLLCGPAPRATSGVEWTLPVEEVTCVHGPVGARTVTVLDASGTVVGRRELDAGTYGGPYRSVVPGADGGLVVADYDPGLPTRLEYPTLDAMFARLPDLPVDTDAAAVHVEDALTAEHRSDVPLQQMTWLERNALQCYETRSSETNPGLPGPSIVADLTLPTPVATATLVTYHGCGVDGTISTDGRSLGADTEAFDAGHLGTGVERLPVPGGGYVVPTAAGSALVRDDGTVVAESPVQIAVPTATDGRSADGLLGVDGDAVVELAADGTELWRAPAERPRVVARTADAVVVAAWDGLAAYRPQSGALRWRLPPPDGVRWVVPSAVTDGRRAAMAVRAVGQVAMSTRLVTVDLRTGAATTSSLDVDREAYVAAVAGRALLVEPTTDEGSGQDAVVVSGLAATPGSAPSGPTG